MRSFLKSSYQSFGFADLSSPSAYDTDYIRVELKKLGFVSGPMAGTSTKKLYLRKLRRLKKTVSSPMRRLLKQPGKTFEVGSMRNLRATDERVISCKNISL